jgi:hypothetical protein
MRGREEKLIQSFDSKELLGRPKHRLEGNIKMAFK